MPPLVSIIIPCYNAERWVGEAIQSALDQTHSPIEVIVADDGSTDGSVVAAEAVAARSPFRVTVLKLPHKGACAARNEGFRQSQGHYVQWLDSDDLLEPGKIAQQVKIADENRGAVVYGPWFHLIETQQGTRVGPRSGLHAVADPLASHLAGFLAPCHAFVTPHAIIDRVGGWDEALLADQDGDLFMRLMIQGVPFVHAPGGAAIWCHRSAGTRISQQHSLASFESRLSVVLRVANELRNQGRMGLYAAVLAQRLDGLARQTVLDYPEFALKCLRTARDLAPAYRLTGGQKQVWLRRVFGLRAAALAFRWRGRYDELLGRDPGFRLNWLFEPRP